MIHFRFTRPMALLLTLSLTACAGTPSRPATPAAAQSTHANAATAPATAASAPATASSVRPAAPLNPDGAGDGSALAARIAALIHQPRFAAARWGVSVRSLADGHGVYMHDADKLFIPASNAKLYTAVLALADLGPKFRFETSLYATAHPDQHGRLKGDLMLVGGGDPSLGAGNDQQSPTAWADRLASVMQARGIRRVHGDLVVDATRYRGTPVGSGWEANDLQWSFAPLASAMSVQGNTFDVRVDGNTRRCCHIRIDPVDAGVEVHNLTRPADADRSDHPRIGLYRRPGNRALYVYGSLPPGRTVRYFELSAPDPAHMAGALLRDAMVRHGILLDGHIVTRHWPQSPVRGEHARDWRITGIRSAPLSDLVRHTLKESDNLYAQLLLLAVGHQRQQSGVCDDQPRPPQTTQGWGLCAMRDLLRRIGIGDGQVLLEEGTGLSRKDLVTPAATTRLLAWAARQPFAAALRDALPEAGVDGTLRYRLRDPDTEGNLVAKTGTLHFAYTLSGYVRDRAGQPLAFSIMLNNYHAPVDAQGHRIATRPTAELDAVARAITDSEAGTALGPIRKASPGAASAAETPAPSPDP
jgi:serine-type D-Ala-D-Ala carboxypeptidase/endopeptidase (penicillin-binding protein 4)